MPEYQRHTEERDINWFLDTVVVRDIGAAIEAGAGYLAFALIAQSIELIGALLDEKEFDFYEQGLPEKRFAKGITEVFNPIDARYGQYNKEDSAFYLWEHLRCGMAHIIRPKSKLVFTGRSDAKKLSAGHLDIIKFEDGEEYLLLIVEDFHDHLTDACRRVKNKIPKKTHAKLRKGYITISYVKPPFYGLPDSQDASANYLSLSGSLIEVPITGAAPGIL